MADLPTNLKDDILDSSVNTRRKYRMIENGDGTYSFEDATEYSQVGDEYGAGLINETNKQVNARVEKAVVVRDLDTIGAITQPGFIPDALALKDVNNSLGGLRFGTDGEGNYGYFGDDDILIPFKSGYTELTDLYIATSWGSWVSFGSLTVGNENVYTATKDCVAIIYGDILASSNSSFTVTTDAKDTSTLIIESSTKAYGTITLKKGDTVRILTGGTGYSRYHVLFAILQ